MLWAWTRQWSCCAIREVSRVLVVFKLVFYQSFIQNTLFFLWIFVDDVCIFRSICRCSIIPFLHIHKQHVFLQRHDETLLSVWVQRGAQTCDGGTNSWWSQSNMHCVYIKMSNRHTVTHHIYKSTVCVCVCVCGGYTQACAPAFAFPRTTLWNEQCACWK